ncbi:MAG: DUF1289 domain-containing protein [Cupriavidus sp.]|nr:MAG: DUF1289 domain-containing protein [Cupriavidus sp.]
MNTIDVPSPCVQICKLDAGNICTGCGRSLAEIAEWSSASNQRKQKISDAARQRRGEMKAHGNHPAE